MTASMKLALTPADRAAAAAWTQTHGPLWAAETLHTDTQQPFLSLVTPSSEDGMTSWLIVREAAGLLLLDPNTGDTRATAATMEEALSFVEEVEEAFAQEAGMTGAEQDAAAVWAAGQGNGWGVETFHADDGRTALGVFSPHRWDETFDAEQYAFIVTRSAEGVALLETRSFAELGIFASVGAALAHAGSVPQSAN
jgi:hypothetical protein